MQVNETDPLVDKGDEEPLKTTAIITVFFACLSGLLLGYDVGVANGSLAPVAATFALGTKRKELYVGILNLCAMPGVLVGGWLADKWGRRRVIMLGAGLFLCGNATMTFASTYTQLIVGRSCAGFAVGITLVAEPLYTSEIAPQRLRGLLTTNVEVSFNIGIVLGFVASWAFHSLPDDVSWRWMIGASLWAPVVSLLGMAFIVPESPRWLAMQGRHEEASAALNEVLGPREAAAAMQSWKQETSQDEMDWFTMLTTCPTAWFAFVGGGVAFFSQATGIETVIYYSSVIFAEAGMSKDTIFAATISMGLCKVAAILVSGQFVDSVGRKPLLIISALGMAMSMFSLAFSFQSSSGEVGKVVPITSFVVFFSLGFGPIVYMLNTELYPTSCRSKGITLGMGIGRILSALVASSFLSLTDVLGFAGAFVLFGCMGILAAAFVTLCVTETKGTSLESRDSEAMQKRGV